MTYLAHLGLAVHTRAQVLRHARTGLACLARELAPCLFAPLFGRSFRGRSATPAASRFRVLSLNGGGNAHASDAPRLLRTLAIADADVVALQELTPATFALLRRELPSRYPHSAGSSSGVVFSRFPLRGARTVSFVGPGSDAQRVELQVGCQRLTVFNVHLTRPAYQLWDRRAFVRFLLDYDPSLRDAHAATIKAQLRDTRGPILVMGDLNGTEWSHAYRLLCAGLGDSFREVARGFGLTYRAALRWGSMRLWLPLVRIDYILHSPELVALEAHVGPDCGSDHLPVVAELAFARASGGLPANALEVNQVSTGS